jgi:hypothetical protein
VIARDRACLTPVSAKCYKNDELGLKCISLFWGRASHSDAAKPQTTVLDVEARFPEVPVRAFTTNHDLTFLEGFLCTPGSPRARWLA